MSAPEFFQTPTRIRPVADIRWIDIRYLEHGRVYVRMRNGSVGMLEGQLAIDLVMQVCPSALEGRRLRWLRHRWAVHNLIGHPGMQVLAWLGKTRAGMKLHAATVPRPKATGPLPKVVPRK